MLLPELAAEDGLGGVQVDSLAAQQRQDPGRPGRAQVTDPVLLLGVVGEQDLFRHLVDVSGRDPGEPYPGRADERRVVCSPGKFLQAPVHESGRADAISPQERGDRHPPLREPAGILPCGRRGVHVLQVDAVLHDMQQGGHVFPDAGLQQGQDPPVAAQLRDFPHDQAINVRREFGGAGGERTGDV